MDSIWRDFAYAIRVLRKSPGFALTAILTIALGIGASTAIFSVVNAVLLQPLPYGDQERLVHVWPELRSRGVAEFAHPPADVVDLRQQATLFDGFAAITTSRRTIGGSEETDAEMIPQAFVTPNFFQLMGARIIEGRAFREEDAPPPPQPPPAPAQVTDTLPGKAAQPGKAPATAQPPQQQGPPPPPPNVILGHGFWQRRFGGDRAIVGTVVDLNGRFNRVNVVGVLEPGFEVLFPPGIQIEAKPEIWTPVWLDPNSNRSNVFLRVVGRLKAGVTLAQAQAEVAGISADLRKRFAGKESAGLHFRLERMDEDLVADVSPAIWALMGAVILVLVIACANVANLLLVRASSRGRELAIRAALGAGASRIVRQMLTESLAIAGAGALLGVLLARWGIVLLMWLRPANLPRIEQVAIDAWVMLFTALAAMISAVIFGLAPALRAARPDVADVLRQSGQTAGVSGGKLLRNGVVVAEVALSFVLLIGAGLMIRSFVTLQRANPGFDAQNLLTFNMPNPRVQGAAAALAQGQAMRTRLAALPGVQAVSSVGPLPLDGSNALTRWGTEEALTDATKFRQCVFYRVAPGFFSAMRTPLLAGRDFTAEDSQPETRVLIVDSVLAAKVSPGASPVGKRILMRAGFGPDGDVPQWYEIIGVAAHQRNTSLVTDGRESLYVPWIRFGWTSRWVLRTTGDPTALAGAARAELRAINRSAAVDEMQPMTVFVERAQAQTRFALALIAVFGAIAGVLTAVGLYGVLATVVRQRSAEIGVRMAFGATCSNILCLILGHGLKLAGAGIVVGVLAAMGATRYLRTMLIGVQPNDPATFVAIIALLAAVAVGACLVPALRATRVDPMVALRHD